MGGHDINCGSKHHVSKCTAKVDMASRSSDAIGTVDSVLSRACRVIASLGVGLRRRRLGEA